jgi:hypothetical protein
MAVGNWKGDDVDPIWKRIMELQATMFIILRFASACNIG